MSKSPGESKIPIFHSNHLKNKISRPFASLSIQLRAHLDGENRSLTSSVLLGILGASNIGTFKNVNIGKAITVSNLSKVHQTASHDDLKPLKLLTRPTSIFISGQYFPTLGTGRANNFSVVGTAHLGRRVILSSGQEGVVRYVGETQFAEGVWCGVELDKEDGTSDGVINNVRYFTCPKSRGVFVLLSNVNLAPEEVSRYLSEVSDSSPQSLLSVTDDSEAIQDESEDKPAICSEAPYFHKEKARRCSSCNIQQASQTPTSSRSNSSFAVLCEWRCNSFRFSSDSSLVLNYRGLPSSLDPSSVQMSKHSSFECDESLGVLTPDQMAELIPYRGGDGDGDRSFDDFRSLVYLDHTTACREIDLNEECKNLKYSSIDAILEPVSTEMMPNVKQNELMDRLFDEIDTCVMSTSSVDDQLEPLEYNMLRALSVEDLLAVDANIPTRLVASEQFVEDPVRAPATSFVTSVISIGSWDNGYQGDGECSRPTSRGADASPLSRIKPMANKPLEPMTDSDFFTESDTDWYDDIICLRRDRNARVIDGKLFGSPVNTKLITSQSYSTQILSAELYGVQHEQSVPEEMDSSGVYSDFDKKSEAIEKPVEIKGDAQRVEEIYPAPTLSSASISNEESIYKDENGMVTKMGDEAEAEKKVIVQMPISKSAKSTISVKQEKIMKRIRSDTLSKKEFSKSSSSLISDEPKISRHNVMSKVKSQIAASSKCSKDDNQENRPVNVQNIPKKSCGRWDSVLSKIEKGKIDQKKKAEKVKDVKNKIYSMPRIQQSKLYKDVKPFSPNGNAMNNVDIVKQKEIRSYRFKIHKIKSLNREASVPLTAVTAPIISSQTSSRNSSVTDISDSLVDISQHSLSTVPIAVEYSNSKKASSPLCSPLSESGVSTVALQSFIVNTKNIKMSSLPEATTSALKQRQIGNVFSSVENSLTMKAPRKMTCRRIFPEGTLLKDQNRLQTLNGTGSCSIKGITTLKPLSDRTIRIHRSVDGACKTVKSKIGKRFNQVAKVNPLLLQLKYATNGMQAFIILFQQLTSDADVFALSHIKEELNEYKQDWLNMKLKLEEANVSCRRLKEEIEMQKLLYDQKLEEMREMHVSQLDRLNQIHNEEFAARSDEYEKELNVLEKKLKDQETLLQSTFNENLSQIRKQAEQKLESILEGTKNLVEMLKIENHLWKEKLIKESLRKIEEVETKFKNKIERVEANCVNQLNEADEEAKKREELFLSSMKRKFVARCVPRGESASSKSCVETTSNIIKPDVQNLEEEISSLRIVLDLKHSEIQDLRKQNEKLQKHVQDLPFISQKLDSSQARVEDLNEQLQTKIENEIMLLNENRKLLETIQQECEKKKRLAFHNEELLWKLKRNTQVAKTLAVFKNKLQTEELDLTQSGDGIRGDCRCRLTFSDKKPLKQLKRSRTDADIKFIESPTEVNTSPKVLGVVEKSDSVSWVLEIDEPPLAVASRMLRRADSLRSVPCNKKKSASNEQSLTLPSRNKKSSTTDISNASDLVKRDVNAYEVDQHGSVDHDENIYSSGIPSAKNNGNENSNISEEIASFFDFFHDSDLDASLVNCDNADNQDIFCRVTKGLMSNISSSNSDSSLDLEIYDKLTDSYCWWQKAGDQKCGEKAPKAIIEFSLSDIEDSEPVESFITPTMGTILNELGNSTTE